MKNLLAAALFGALLSAIALIVIPGSNCRKAYDALVACEAKLPRYQTCEITATPRSKP